MASPFFAIYTKNLSRIYYAELIDETAASASMAQQRSVSIGKSGADLGYSIATLRAPSEIQAEHRTRQDRDMTDSTCFDIPFAASDAS
jgi:hypothetical protein